jgi:hypothetical protein
VSLGEWVSFPTSRVFSFNHINGFWVFKMPPQMSQVGHYHTLMGLVRFERLTIHVAYLYSSIVCYIMLYEIEGFIEVCIHEWILCIVLCIYSSVTARDSWRSQFLINEIISSDESNHFSTGVGGFCLDVTDNTKSWWVNHQNKLQLELGCQQYWHGCTTRSSQEVSWVI